MTGSQAPEIKAALVALIRELSQAAQVIYGARATQAKPTVMAVRGITTQIERPTLGNNPRSRDYHHIVTVTASVFRPGAGDRAQQEATEAAYALLDLLDLHLRSDLGPTLGISGRIDAWISGMTLDEHTDDDELQTAGRYAEVTAEVAVDAYRT